MRINKTGKKIKNTKNVFFKNGQFFQGKKTKEKNQLENKNRNEK